jgi:hypothetical protein
MIDLSHFFNLFSLLPGSLNVNAEVPGLDAIRILNAL